MSAATYELQAVDWPTPCCDRTPIRLDRERVACRVCGVIWHDTAETVRRVFGPGVVNVIDREADVYRVLTQDEYETIYREGV